MRLTTTTPSTADAIAAYKSGVSGLLTSALDNDVLLDVRRADFDAALIARLDNALDDRMRWAFAFDENQRERVRLLRETLNTHVEHYRAMWRREMIRNIVQIRSDAWLARARVIIEAADSDDDNAAEGAEPDGAVMAEGRREDSENESEVGNEEEADEESEDVDEVKDEDQDEEDEAKEVEDPYDESDDDEDCIMVGMYNGGQGVSRRWACLLCPNHRGTQHKTSFLRHLRMSHGFRNVLSAMTNLA